MDQVQGATTTKAGLKVESALDTRNYGIKVSKAEMKYLDITGDQFHSEIHDQAETVAKIVAVLVRDVLV